MKRLCAATLLALSALAPLPAWALQAQVSDGFAPERSNLTGSKAARAAESLSPQQRQAAHAMAFEKDFMVELNMTEAHASGRSMGVQLDTDTDFTPVSVLRIRKTGAMEMWNRANPDLAVHVGDQIMKVNNILWHHNSLTFAERIKAQYKASKEYKEGAKRVLTLHIQRPKQQSQVRFQSQREDLHRSIYSREFVAEIPCAQQHALGWRLNSTVDWVPVSVSAVDRGGAVALWNQEHPEYRIYPGDEILQANRVQWHHNSKTFADRIRKQWESTAAGKVSKRATVSLKVRRPRSVVEQLENRSFLKTFFANLTWTNASRPFGWQLQADTTEPAAIRSIAGDSVLGEWNLAHPEQGLAVGDRILKVTTPSGMQWHYTKPNFASNLQKVLDVIRASSGASAGVRLDVTLLVQRRIEVSYSKGWLVEIPAKAEQNLGLQVEASDDELPVTIKEIRPLGAVGLFNEDNPEDAVTPGDHIMKVNDVLWRRDSRQFEKSLAKQFTRSKRAHKVRLWIQRPEGVDPEASADEGGADYSDFSVELPVTSPKAMGWELNAKEGEPVAINAVHKNGSVWSWNGLNPMKDIEAGDQLLQVDDNVWHNNTLTFLQRLRRQLEAASKGVGSKRSISMMFRRRYSDESDSDEAEDQPEVLGDGDVMGAEQ